MSKIRIGLTLPILSADQTKLEQDNKTVTMKDTLISILSRQTEGDSVKQWGWIKEAHETNELVLDKSDFETLKSTIEKDKNTLAFAKGQLLEHLIASKDAKPPKGANAGRGRNASANNAESQGGEN